MSTQQKIKLGVSACLLGQKVRYDGGHQLNHYIRDVLGNYIEFVPVCPEVECGMPTPRESVRLTGSVDNPRLVTSRTGIDHTDQMVKWAEKRVRELEKEDLCGFIFKKNSPSSGLYRVKVYNEKKQPVKKGMGIFPKVFTRHFPLLPVEEDGRLNDPKLRETFIEQIFVFKNVRQLLSEEKKRGSLVDFHTRHKLLILSHSTKHYRELGKQVGNMSEDMETEYENYIKILSDAMSLKSTVPKQCNVLQHIMGYFKKHISPDEKQEVLELIDLYRNGHLPLIVPVTILNHYVRKYDQPYLKKQYYLNPHPLELHLRNHV